VSAATPSCGRQPVSSASALRESEVRDHAATLFRIPSPSCLADVGGADVNSVFHPPIGHRLGATGLYGLLCELTHD
jgi:hypothetical protein